MSKTIGNAPGPLRSAGEWSRLVEDWRRSRKITREFCQARGLSVKTFQWWRWALTKHGGCAARRSRRAPVNSPVPTATVVVQASPPRVPAFIEVVTPATAPSAIPKRQASGVEVIVAGRSSERRVRVEANFDVPTLRQVVAALEEV